MLPLRLGLRMVKGLANLDAARILAARERRFLEKKRRAGGAPLHQLRWSPSPRKRGEECASADPSTGSGLASIGTCG